MSLHRQTGLCLALAFGTITGCKSSAPTLPDGHPPAEGRHANPPPAAPPGSQGSDEMQLPAPKRVGPDEVAPVQIGNVIYQAIHWGRERGLPQNGGYLEAIDASTRKPMWTLRVYAIEYDPSLEEDVQDVFIARLTAGPANHELTVVDENDRRFVVNVQSRSVDPAVETKPPR